MTLLMNGGAHGNVRDNQGCLALHLAAWTGNVDICKTLLLSSTSSDVNAQVGVLAFKLIDYACFRNTQ